HRARKSSARYTSRILQAFHLSKRKPGSPAQQEQTRRDPGLRKCYSSTSEATLLVQSTFRSRRPFESSSEGNPRSGPQPAVSRSQTPHAAPSIRASPFRLSQFLFYRNRLIRGRRLCKRRLVLWSRYS